MAKKDKEAKRINMKDLMMEHQTEEVKSEGPVDVNSFKFDEDYEKKLIEYNKNVTNLDEFYTSLTPRSKVLVRVFVNELKKTEAGLLIANKEMVKAPTQNGVSILGEMESPFPYSRKAVVISTPEFIKDLEPGSVVLLSRQPVEAVAVGRGDNATIRIPFGFTHPDLYDRSDLPTDPQDRSYGYLLVPSQELEIKHG